MRQCGAYGRLWFPWLIVWHNGLRSEFQHLKLSDIVFARLRLNGQHIYIEIKNFHVLILSYLLETIMLF